MCQGYGLKYLVSPGGQQAKHRDTCVTGINGLRNGTQTFSRQERWVRSNWPHNTWGQAKVDAITPWFGWPIQRLEWYTESVLIFLSYHFGQKVSTTSILENVRTTESRQTNKPINYHQLINSMTTWPPNFPTNCCLHGVLWILIAPEEGFPQSLHVLCLVLHALALEAQLCRQSFANCLHRLAAPETTIRRSYSRDGHKFQHGQSMSISINFFWRLATFCPSGQDQLPSKSIGPWLSPASAVEILSPVHPRHNCHRFLWTSIWASSKTIVKPCKM